MSSILSSQAVALATAMAVSGTVILLALRQKKTALFVLNPIPQNPNQSPRSCISSGGKDREKKKKKKKKVHFAEDVVDPAGNGEEFRKQRALAGGGGNSGKAEVRRAAGDGGSRRMPANREALYNGILRDRGVHRLACAY